MRDFYEILEINRDASVSEIKKSYKKLAKKYHPDLNQGDKEAEAKFKEISVAYEVLSDEQKRSNYDRFGEDGINGNFQDSGFGGFGDIFGDIFDIFGGGGFQRESGADRRDIPIKGEDIRYDVNLSFREAVFGVEKTISIRRLEECKTCNGTGAEEGSKVETCDRCHGTGQMKVQSSSPFGRVVRVVDCDKCHGTGETIENPCKKCHGVGKETVNKKINVKIPAGVDNNTVITMSGEGHAGENGGPKGDLYIYLNVKEDSVFKRRGNDLYLEMPISYVDAVLGGTIKVPTLTSLIDYEIPKGTQGGTTFKIKNEGVPFVRREGKGNLYIIIDIIVPKKTSEEQRRILEELRENSSKGHEEIKKERKGFFEKFKELFE